MEKKNQTQPDPHDPEKSRGLRNVLDVILLLAGLAAAWFLLEWLMGRK